MHRLKIIEWAKVKYVLRGILVGIVAGIVVSAFRMAIYELLGVLPNVYNYVRNNILWLFVWTVIILLSGLIVVRLSHDEPYIQGNGVAELKGQLQGVMHLNWFSILWKKFVGSLLVLGLGIPLGQEGPSIQIGGVVGQGVNKFLKGNKSQENILISSGAAAGLSTAFNAPLSAFVLVLEEIHHRFSNVLILSVFSASVTASFLSFRIFGSEPSIALGPTTVFPIENYLYLAGLGIILGIGGWIFQRGLFKWTPRIFEKLPLPRYLHGFIPFLLLIPVGLYWSEMLGGGTDVITTIASERVSTILLLGILIFRFVYFNVSYGSGIPGGVLVPSLAFGAILGAIYGNLALGLTGLEDPFLRNFVIYGMGGFFTATTKAPLTGIVLITELTGSMNQLMPISIVCLSAYVISDMLRMEPTDEITLFNRTKHFPTVFKGELMQLDVTVKFDSELDGIRMNEFDLPYNSKVVKVKRYENEFLPHKNTILLPGDELRISCDKGFLQEVDRYVEKMNI